MRKNDKMKKRILYIVCLMLAVVLCTGCTDREEKQLDYRQKGITLMENGDYEEALEGLDEDDRAIAKLALNQRRKAITLLPALYTRKKSHQRGGGR